MMKCKCPACGEVFEPEMLESEYDEEMEDELEGEIPEEGMKVVEVDVEKVEPEKEAMIKQKLKELGKLLGNV